MTLLEAYSFVFADALMEGLAVTLHHAYVYKAMLIFGGYNPLLIWLLASLGAGLGYSINWGIGKLLRSWKKTDALEEPGSVSEAAAFIRNYIRILLPLVWILPSLGGLLTVAAGLFRVPFRQHVALVMLGNMAWFAYVVYYGM